MTDTVRKPRPARKTGNPIEDKTLTDAIGDKLVDNMAAELAARTNGSKAPVSPRDMTNVRVYGPNGIDGGGHFHVHKAGCKDLGKAMYRSLASEAWGTSSQTQYDIVLGIYEDIIAEHTPRYASEANGVHDMASTVTFFPCLDGLLVELGSDARQPKAIRRPRGKAAAKPEATPEHVMGPGGEAPAAELETPAPTEPATTDTKAVKRLAKQDLARRVAQAIAAALTDAQLDGSAVLTGMTSDEARRCAAQWTHHLPTGTSEDGKRWWPETLPRPDRSDWA